MRLVERARPLLRVVVPYISQTIFRPSYEVSPPLRPIFRGVEVVCATAFPASSSSVRQLLI